MFPFCSLDEYCLSLWVGGVEVKYLIELACLPVQDDKDSENLESGEETFFPALCVGTKKTAAVVTFLSFCP